LRESSILTLLILLSLRIHCVSIFREVSLTALISYSQADILPVKRTLSGDTGQSPLGPDVVWLTPSVSLLSKCLHDLKFRDHLFTPCPARRLSVIDTEKILIDALVKKQTTLRNIIFGRVVWDP
jgi:hypothetical protein